MLLNPHFFFDQLLVLSTSAISNWILIRDNKILLNKSVTLESIFLYSLCFIAVSKSDHFEINFSFRWPFLQSSDQIVYLVNVIVLLMLLVSPTFKVISYSGTNYNQKVIILHCYSQW
jgi:hypothetical protein